MPRVPGCDAVYEVANQWRDRCLIGDGSLLWPNLDEPTWTVEDIDRARICMGDLVEKRTMRDVNMIDRFRDEPDSTKRVIADATAIWNICPGFPTPRNRKAVTAGVAEAASPDPNFELFNRAIDCEIGKPEQRRNSTMYQAGRGWDLHFLLTFCLQLKSTQSDPNNFIEIRAVGSKLASSLKDGSGVLNMVLHMLFPYSVEPIFSVRDRTEILESVDFAHMAVGVSDPDEFIATVRSELVRQGQPQDFSFYDDEVYPRWVGPKRNQKRQSLERTPSTTSEDVDLHLVDQRQELDPLRNLAVLTSSSNESLAETSSLIASKKQIILEGPPGSGKTYVARLFARYLAGLPLEGAVDEHVEIVQFHQSYGYEDFVAGIRPITNADSGQLTYETRPGIFVEMCQRALEKPDETFVLIIDEINRGNLSRIFGELLYGLEYRDQPVRMQYPVSIDGSEQQHLTIPNNLYLIGTMNSTDRSLAMIDYALRRRFYFWRLMPVEGNDAPVLRRWLDTRAEIDPADRERLMDAFIALNGSIVQLLGEDYQIGHSYFMLSDGQLADPAAIEQVWRHAIEPLLREYFHTRHDAGTHIDKMRAHFFAPPVLPETAFDEDLAES